MRGHKPASSLQRVLGARASQSVRWNQEEIAKLIANFPLVGSDPNIWHRKLAVRAALDVSDQEQFRFIRKVIERGEKLTGAMSHQARRYLFVIYNEYDRLRDNKPQLLQMALRHLAFPGIMECARDCDFRFVGIGTPIATYYIADRLFAITWALPTAEWNRINGFPTLATAQANIWLHPCKGCIELPDTWHWVSTEGDHARESLSRLSNYAFVGTMASTGTFTLAETQSAEDLLGANIFELLDCINAAPMQYLIPTRALRTLYKHRQKVV